MRRFRMFLAVLICLVAVSASYADTLIGVNREGKQFTLTCNVLEEHYDKTRIEVPGRGTASLDSEFIVEIRRSDLPLTYRQALEKLAVGDLAEAVRLFKTCYEAEATPDWAKWYSLHQYGKLSMKLAEIEKKPKYYESAIVGFQILVKKWPQARYAPDAEVRTGQCLARLGRLEEAAEKFQEVAEKPDYLPLAKFRGRVGLARVRVLEAAKASGTSRKSNLEKAIETADAIVRDVADETHPFFREFKYEALLVKAEALLELGEFNVEHRRQAESVCQQIVVGSNRVDLKAHATNFRGDSLRKREYMREAWLAYMRTVVLYHEEEHAYDKALYWGTVCAAKYGNPTAVKRLYNEMRIKRPTSPWTARLKQELPKLLSEAEKKQETPT